MARTHSADSFLDTHLHHMGHLMSLSAKQSSSAPAPVTLVAVKLFDILRSESGMDGVHECIDALLRQHRGSRVEGEPDTFMYSFKYAPDAVDWSLDLQVALGQMERTRGVESLQADSKPVSAAIFIHRGRAQGPTSLASRDQQLTGPGIAWLLTVIPCIHPGQIILSDQDWREIHAQGRIERAYLETALGKHRMRNTEIALSFVQLLPPDAPLQQFPPLDTVSSTKTNLPGNLQPFFGRENELAQLTEGFERGSRLVVLKGPGGIGKTRLATRFANLHIEDFSSNGEGVWICDCTESRSISGVVHALASVLNVPLTVRGLQATNQLGNALASRGRTLIVLDNFDHATEYAQLTIGLWMSKAREAHFIVTSRSRLDIASAQHIEVSALSQDEAVALFQEGARRAGAELDWSEDVQESVAELVDRLEGHPLAVVLASAWAGLLSAKGILDRVSQGLKYLAGGEVDIVEPRHANLRAVVEWSWNLLRPHEQDVLAQCAVFVGGFTLEAAEAVVDLSRHRERHNVSQIIRSLLDKSLMRLMDGGGDTAEVRFSLYESVREYAEERLAAMGYRPTTEMNHAQYYLDLARRVANSKTEERFEAGYALLTLEFNNLIAIQPRCRGVNRTLASEVALLLHPLLSSQGPFSKHLSVLEAGTEYADGATPQMTVDVLVARAEILHRRGRQDEAQALIGRAIEWGEEKGASTASAQSLQGVINIQSGRVEQGATALNQATEAFIEEDNRSGWALAIARIGEHCADLGRLDDAERRFTAASKAFVSVGDSQSNASVLAQLGNVRRAQGRPEESQELYLQALATHERAKDLPSQGRVMSYLGSLLLDLKQLPEAFEYYQRALEIFEQVGDTRQKGILLGNIGRLKHHLGQSAEALEFYQKGIEALQEVQDYRFMAIFQGAQGTLYHELGQEEHAADVYSAAYTALAKLGDRRFQALILARIGALAADQGDLQQAATSFKRAKELVTKVQDPRGGQAVHVHSAHVLVALFKQSRDKRHLNAAMDVFKNAMKPTAEGQASPAESSSDVRLALRLLRMAVESVN